MIETWKEIKGYEGYYEVSDEGRVRSLDRIATDGRRLKGKILEGSIDSYGYKVVGLSKGGKATQHKIHQLVLGAFSDNPNNLPDVDHINAVKTDNRLVNLRYTDPYGNTHNPLTMKAIKECGERKRKGVLQYKDGKLIREYATLQEAGEVNGFDFGTIAKCCRGKYKTSYGYVWKYAS